MNRLIYFPIPGRAEPIRIALSLSDLEWEDIQIDGNEYYKMKKSGELPWGLLPILQTSSGTLAESSAILRYVGHRAGLIPNEAYAAAKADEIIDALETFSEILSSTVRISDIEERIEARKNLFEADGIGTKSLTVWEEKVLQTESGWIANSEEMSIADLKLFTQVFGLFSGNWDGVNTDIIKDYPNLIKYHSLVANEPRILEHYSNISGEDLRWTYQPGAFNN